MSAKLLATGADWITFTSGSTVEHFHKRFDLPGVVEEVPTNQTRLIGPETTKTIETLGATPGAEAKQHDGGVGRGRSEERNRK